MGYISFTKYHSFGINNFRRELLSVTLFHNFFIGLSCRGECLERINCRNSVFCVKFLLYFLIGTICGIWFYRCMIAQETDWLKSYCVGLEGNLPRFSVVAMLRPLVFAYLISLHSAGAYFLPALVFLRGFLTAYTTCAVLRLDFAVGLVLTRCVLILPVFYLLCCRSLHHQANGTGIFEREKIVRGKLYGSCIEKL